MKSFCLVKSNPPARFNTKAVLKNSPANSNRSAIRQIIKGRTDKFIQRTPDEPGTEPAPEKKVEERKDEVQWNWKDLLLYPLIGDILKDLSEDSIFMEMLKKTKAVKEPEESRLNPEERKAMQLKGSEASAFYPWVFAIPYAIWGKGDVSYLDYVKALEPLTMDESIYLGPLSRLFNVRLDKYLSSDLFTLRLKNRLAALIMAGVLIVPTYHLIQAYKESDKKPGELDTANLEKHTSLYITLINDVFMKDKLKPPNFFDIGPLKLDVHPAFKGSEFAGGPPPSGISLESKTGVGEEGSQHKYAFTLNPVILGAMVSKGEVSPEDTLNLVKYRKPQFSLWFSHEGVTPTPTMLSQGKLPFGQVKGGTVFGHAGYMALLETGARFTGQDASELTSWFVKGGFGYNGETNSVLRKIGFTATFMDWKSTDILAPGAEKGAPQAGWGLQMSPFFKLMFGEGKEHQFSAALALSLVTGSNEPFNVSGFSTDFSYIYMGSRSKDQLPVFKLDLTGFGQRLDWYNPDSPWLGGFRVKASYDRFFGALQYMGGEGKIPDYRARLMGKPEEFSVPTVMVLTGYSF